MAQPAHSKRTANAQRFHFETDAKPPTRLIAANEVVNYSGAAWAKPTTHRHAMRHSC
jgi:hypothetical protein